MVPRIPSSLLLSCILHLVAVHVLTIDQLQGKESLSHIEAVHTNG